MTPSAVLAELAHDARALAPRHGLAPVPLEPAFRSREGDWNGRPLTLTTELFRGPGKLARLQVAVVTSAADAMASLTVIALPATWTNSPVLGVDMVAFGGALGTVIVDLTPMGTPLSQATLEALAASRAALAAASEPRRWTDEGPSPFSEHAVFVSPSRADGLGPSAQVYLAWSAAFELELAHGAPLAPGASEPAQRAYLHRLGLAKKQSRSLSRLFGAAWTERYFDEVFFRHP